MELKSIGRKAGKYLGVGVSALFASVLLGAMPTLAAGGPVLNVSILPITNGALPTAPGNAVTYIYQVWNTGDVPVANIRISDNQCTLVTYDAVGQDLNVDHMLDKGELWSYYCTIIPQSSVLNIATVTGRVNGVTIGATTSAIINIPGTTLNGGTTTTVTGNGTTPAGTVKKPGLPNTGFSPSRNKHVEAAPSYLSSIGPQQLQIPSIHVNAPVETVGITSNGNMEAPSSANNVGWLPTTLPGQSGSTVLAGHVNTATDSSGVFKDLKSLRTGDDVYITNGQNQTLHYEVSNNQSYNVNAAPVEAIFGNADSSHLNLITCDGAWDNRTHQYSKRRVVYTDLVQD